MLRKNGIFIGMAILIVLIVGLMFSSFPNISGFLSILCSKINFPTIYPDAILLHRNQDFPATGTGLKNIIKIRVFG